MKKLSIVSDSCLLSKSTYGLEINGEQMEKMIIKSLPKKLEDYTKYPVAIKIEIELLGESGLKILPEGYQIENDESEEKEDA